MRRVPLVLLIALCLTQGGAHALEAGAAKVEITPPLGTPLNGYYDRLGRGATAVHDPVWVRCLYLNDGDTGLFLVSADLCAINKELRARVLELAPKEVPPEHIILTATHTHSAQGGMIRGVLFRSVSGRFMPDVLEQTAGRFAEAMRAAYQARKRAAIGFATAAQEGLSVNRRDKDGPVDSQVGVIRVEDSDGNPIAIVANFAAHPTSVGGADQFSISADYPGFYYAELEQRAGDGCVAMFMNGAEGNQTCANPEGKSGWGKTESVGRLLAQLVMKTADTISCGDAKLAIGYATPELPPTIAPDLFSSTTVIQTLEIDDLLLTFYPGEPCVELALRMRERALARGYAAQFSVGLANDYLLYFAPAESYSHLCYETAMSFFGPRIEEWLSRQFSLLMTRGESEPEPEPAAPAGAEALGGAQYLTLTGSPYGIGFQRAAAFREAIAAAYQERIVAPCDSGLLIPEEGLWQFAPPFINLTTFALPRLGIGARPMLAGLSDGVLRELDGMAGGAGMPFDALWLVQIAPTIHAHADVAELYRAPFCTMFAVVGSRAGADDVLVGRNLDWAEPEPPVVIKERPESGCAFVQVGFPWNAGVFTGMNDAGIVVCAERVPARGEPSVDGPPVEFVLRDVLAGADNLESAMARLDQPHLRGYHVLVAERSSATARVIEFGETAVVRAPEEGILLGIEPEAGDIDAEARARYTRLRGLLSEERIVAVPEIQVFLADSAPPEADPAAPPLEQGAIFNPLTRHCVVFEPKPGRMHVAVPGDDGALGEYAAITLGEYEP
ncbi:MAG: neutral/alkaline non-lysosomal ceramidase N-terminal domain-containing protein [Candidatus Hydrogenedentes bacterium]|nr:neutral/alkaline non-lysosomal ceramidase N-terminal domain-containing protein [Candidatus Hydrogenedentota bacterium]